VPVDDQAFGNLTCQSFGSYVSVDLAKPAGSAIESVQLDLDIADLCERITWDDQIRVVILGFDGSIEMALRAETNAECPERCSFVDSVARLTQPVIAAIRGDAIGLGLELALACDIRIGIEGSQFCLPQVPQGRMPSHGGTQRLPRLIGPGKAMQMILTGAPMNAEDACRCGLVNRIVPAAALKSTALEMACEMAAKSPVSLNYVKEALHKGADLTLEQGIAMELNLYLHMFTTSDRAEGIHAFLEKRKPKFEGI
jgi:enoyl-CoA hydratase/carnithine racemase